MRGGSVDGAGRSGGIAGGHRALCQRWRRDRLLRAPLRNPAVRHGLPDITCRSRPARKGRFFSILPVFRIRPASRGVTAMRKLRSEWNLPLVREPLLEQRKAVSQRDFPRAKDRSTGKLSAISQHLAREFAHPSALRETFERGRPGRRRDERAAALHASRPPLPGVWGSQNGGGCQRHACTRAFGPAAGWLARGTAGSWKASFPTDAFGLCFPRDPWPVAQPAPGVQAEPRRRDQARLTGR